MAAAALVKWYVGDLTEDRAKELLGEDEFNEFKEKATQKAWNQYAPTAAITLVGSFGVGYLVGQSGRTKANNKRK